MHWTETAYVKCVNVDIVYYLSDLTRTTLIWTLKIKF